MLRVKPGHVVDVRVLRFRHVNMLVVLGLRLELIFNLCLLCTCLWGREG